MNRLNWKCLTYKGLFYLNDRTHDPRLLGLCLTSLVLCWVSDKDDLFHFQPFISNWLLHNNAEKDAIVISSAVGASDTQQGQLVDV